MKFIILTSIVGIIFSNCNSFGSRLCYQNPTLKLEKVNKIIYFQPSIFPQIEEIKQPTYQVFSVAVSDQMESFNNIKTILMDHSLEYERVDIEYIKEVGRNNQAEAIVVPNIKYFKVGFGKYVFSNQVLISLKLYDAQGNFLIETQYDTYKGNARLLGKAENSIKIGTKTAVKELLKLIRKKTVF
ncbi:MAG: pyruvate decarboxylase [Flavobacteriaceae bacterium]|nr:pyruvate decarboxylase [Flavobacteriaceae bacterium]